MWNFQTDPEFQAKLDWAATFVREECEPLDLLFPHLGQPYNMENKAARAILGPLRDRVKEQGLWACHLGPELGGQGYGQLKLALLNEVLGRSMWAPTVFGTAAPDTGNAEILAMYGTDAQKAKYLQPLLDGDIVSCFSMTEPQAGSDPKEFVCAARKDGDEWVINGEKWFSSNARYASFLIVMAVTDTEASPYRRMSMFVVPAETPGIEIVRNVSVMGDRDELDEGTHAYIRYNDVRLPADAILGGPGQGFEVAQSRLGGGRVHHAMRTVGKCQRALDMMGERVLSRRTQGETLAKKQMVQQFIADSAIELEQYRLLVIKTAWVIDNEPHGAARTYIAMCKVAMAKIYHDIIHRAIQIHGSLGATTETPLHIWWSGVISMGLADGPTEVHKVAVARGVLANYEPTENLFPSEHIPTRLAEAKIKHAAILEEHGIA
ncbi:MULTISPECIES: acyl-CoA dehydrogenase family protein [Rhodococcus]|uniref:Acyl-CoA dehydrogenase n=1 Tax=Nocardia globerula TaxID=1818 RepID=A0A652YHC2_NOCGL|nr:MULTISPECIES: acyl-CoA dehydrogenase family protein [Rhodococcus]NMD64289.1 acyl-CoA dehydrogenase [Nocardia globerula]MDV8071059.1 acyl-CoA dehydrogenase family protein [Rhodococcus sp. IEGM 1366]NRI69991.1 acyl-CoA dehydrogenase [Rhodococcus sp. MS16]PVX63395.1 acyl-CoA dehydrogenase [Rhodococcus globerulus]RZL21260.1 MAG: acyl-CoA dehydrogenase [Rhodococcus sp. (in: high G+C Gram-positive bacteria)]